MQTIVEYFLATERLMRADDFSRFMGWSNETLRQKLARRETPAAIRIKRVVLFSYDAVAKWLAENGEAITPANAQAVAEALKDEALGGAA